MRHGDTEGGCLSIKFFGQFLIENGEVESSHLKDAGNLMYWVNRRIGELAARKGYITRVDVDRIHRAQLGSDVPFGALAVQLGLLTEPQLLELVREQSANQLRIGEALVELGHLDEDRLQQLLDRYDAEQEEYLAQNPQIPEELRESPLVAYVLGHVRTVALRTAFFRVKVGAHRKWAESERCEYGASISIRGDDAIELGITADESFLRALVVARPGPDGEEPSREALTDMLCTFVKVVARNAGAGREKQGVRLKLGSPEPNQLPADGFAFELVSLKGKGHIIIAKP